MCVFKYIANHGWFQITKSNKKAREMLQLMYDSDYDVAARY